MLVHQGDFEVEIDNCNMMINDYLTTFIVSILYLIARRP